MAGGLMLSNNLIAADLYISTLKNSGDWLR
jgi:hypothetical protein